MTRIVQIGLLIAIAGATSGCQWENHERSFNGCRARWLAAFRPDIGLNFKPSIIDTQFMNACMASRGFIPAYEASCSAGSAVTNEACFRRKMPWQ